MDLDNCNFEHVRDRGECPEGVHTFNFFLSQKDNIDAFRFGGDVAMCISGDIDVKLIDNGEKDMRMVRLGIDGKSMIVVGFDCYIRKHGGIKGLYGCFRGNQLLFHILLKEDNLVWN